MIFLGVETKAALDGMEEINIARTIMNKRKEKNLLGGVV